MKFLYILLLVPLLVYPALAQLNAQVLPTDRGTLDVELSTTPANPQAGNIVKLNIGFINPQTNKIQEHIDYRIHVTKDGGNIFGPIPLTHTSVGSVSIPVEFSEDGIYFLLVEVEGILFQPLPLETVSFSIPIGQAQKPTDDQTSSPTSPAEPPPSGCLIATAAFGSELSPQIQELREVRENVVMKTKSGMTFMDGFNQFYYSFSPTVADLERENPTFKETVKLAITPLLTSLSILNYVDIDSEQQMLGYGIGIIMLNVGMYLGIPFILFVKCRKFRSK